MLGLQSQSVLLREHVSASFLGIEAHSNSIPVVLLTVFGGRCVERKSEKMRNFERRDVSGRVAREEYAECLSVLGIVICKSECILRS